MDQPKWQAQGAVTVVTLTQNAQCDALTEDDYREIYQEVRGYDESTGKYRMSLDVFVEQVGEPPSKALWSKYHNGQARLNRSMQSKLRTAVGLAPLSPTIAEAMASVEPNALVVKVGEGTPDRVLLVGEARPVTIGVNGTVTATLGKPTTRDVTAVTRPRTPYIRPVASLAQEERRARLAVAWGQIIEAGLAALEKQSEGNHE